MSSRIDLDRWQESREWYYLWCQIVILYGLLLARSQIESSIWYSQRESFLENKQVPKSNKPDSSKKNQAAADKSSANAGSKKAANSAPASAREKGSPPANKAKQDSNPKAKPKAAAGPASSSTADEKTMPADRPASNSSAKVAADLALPANAGTDAEVKIQSKAKAKTEAKTEAKTGAKTGTKAGPTAPAVHEATAKAAGQDLSPSAVEPVGDMQAGEGDGIKAADSAGSAEAPAAASEPAASASGAAATTAKPSLRPNNIVIGLALAVMGVGIVAVVTLFTPTPTRDQDIPYLLEPLEKHLDAHLRYKAPHSPEHKDWRSDYATEQFIWRNELSKIMLGAPDAKPIENKRDFLLYLGDSFFKDEPHFEEAKTSYLTATATKRIPHEKAYDYSDDELWRRIGYCDIRLGLYDEAEIWLKKAMDINEAAAKGKPRELVLANTYNRILENSAENYARKGQPQLAENIVKMRLKEMGQPEPDFCIEVPVVYDLALAKQAEGNLKQAEHFYEIAIKLCNDADAKRGGVVPETITDNNRDLARVLMDYSHLLRQMHRNDEAIAAMRRALIICDNPPP